MADGQTGFDVVRLKNRAADRRALIAYLETHEPWSSAALAHVFMDGLRPQRCRGWLVKRADGVTVGAVVVYSPCLGRWQAYSAHDDDAAAVVIGSIVNRSPAVHYAGAATHLVPVVPHIPRLFSARVATFVTSTYPSPLKAELDGRTRIAVSEDLDGIVHVFESFGIGIERTKWQLRSALRRLQSRLPIVVMELDGRIVGAITVNGLTRRYMVSDQMVIAPEARGGGRSWLLSARVSSIANAYGLPMCGVMFSTNPMDVSDYEESEGGWVYAGMFEQRRFRGQARLRELAYRFQALDPNANAQFRPFDALPYGAGFDPNEPKVQARFGRRP